MLLDAGCEVTNFIVLIVDIDYYVWYLYFYFYYVLWVVSVQIGIMLP